MYRDFNIVLRELRQQKSYTQIEVIKELENMGLPINRYHISRWEMGHNQPSIQQFIGLCKIYDVKDIYKVFGLKDYTELSGELNKEGKEKLEEYRQLLISSGKYAPVDKEQKIVQFPRRLAPLYDIGASAGTGQFLDSDSYEMVEVPDEVPLNANFALHVCGDSMEPTLHDGEVIWVQQQPTLEMGEIGIFLVDGDSYVKEFRYDTKGIYLYSHNPEYKPKRIMEFNEMRIYGKVVYPKR